MIHTAQLKGISKACLHDATIELCKIQHQSGSFQSTDAHFCFAEPVQRKQHIWSWPRLLPSTEHGWLMQAPMEVSVGCCLLCSHRSPWDCWWVAGERKGHAEVHTRSLFSSSFSQAGPSAHRDLSLKCYSWRGNCTGFGGSGCPAFKSRLAGSRPSVKRQGRHFSPDFTSLEEGGAGGWIAVPKDSPQQGSISYTFCHSANSTETRNKTLAQKQKLSKTCVFCRHETQLWVGKTACCSGF